MCCADEPLKLILLVPASKVPLLVQLPPIVCVYEPASKLLVRLTFPAMINAPVAVFTPAPLKMMLLKLLAPMLPAPGPLKSMVDPVAVNVPLLVQLPPTVCVKEPAVKLPVMLTFPAMDKAPVAVFTPDPLMVRLLKLQELIFAVPVPVKLTVELFGVKVPFFVQLPLTLKVFVPLMVRDAPGSMVRLRQTADAPMTGWFAGADGIVTSVVAVGTPAHQLAMSCQSLLAVPSHVPAMQLVLLFRIPVVPVPNQVRLLKVAAEVFPPHDPVP